MGYGSALAASPDEQGIRMTPERWEQIRDVLEKALELAPGERSAFLNRACSSDQSLRQEKTASRSGYTPDLGTPHECPSASRSERATAGTDPAKRTSVPPLIAIDRVHCRVRCWIDTPCFRAKDEALAVRTPPVAEGCSCFWSPSILQFAFDQCKFGLKDSCSPPDGSSTSMRSTLMHREP